MAVIGAGGARCGLDELRTGRVADWMSLTLYLFCVMI